MDYLKVIKSGHIVETISYSRKPNLTTKGGRAMGQRLSHRSKTNRILNVRRARLKIKRLATINFSKRSIFVTLTFADESLCQGQNFDKGYRSLQRFLQRLRRRHQDQLRYLVVSQFQDSNGRQALHFHMLVSLPIRFRNVISSLWTYGYVSIREVKDIDNVGAYLIAHMPSEEDDRLRGHNLFSYSKNLLQPAVFDGDDAQLLMQSLNVNKNTEVYSASYDTTYLGKLRYIEYNLRRRK